MTEPVGLVAASAVQSQALFGEAATGAATRLHAAFVRELGQARAEAAFAASPGVSAGIHDVRRLDGAGLVDRRLASLDVRESAPGTDARTRVAGAPGERNGGRDGEGGDAGGERDGDDGARALAVDEREIAAIETALSDVTARAGDPEGVGRVRALVLSGEVLGHVSDAPPEAHDCRLLVLCLAADGELSSGRRVWGFGYAEDRLVVTLDARWRDGERDVDEHVDAWRLAVADTDGTRAALRCTCRGVCHEGVALGVSGRDVAFACSLIDPRVLRA